VESKATTPKQWVQATEPSSIKPSAQVSSKQRAELCLGSDIVFPIDCSSVKTSAA